MKSQNPDKRLPQTGPQMQIVGRRDCHSGSHITSALPLPPRFMCILQKSRQELSPYLMGSKSKKTTNVLLLLVQALFSAGSVKYQFLKTLCHVPQFLGFQPFSLSNHGILWSGMFYFSFKITLIILKQYYSGIYFIRPCLSATREKKAPMQCIISG